VKLQVQDVQNITTSRCVTTSSEMREAGHESQLLTKGDVVMVLQAALCAFVEHVVCFERADS
jgi:hypothetical protein